MKQNKTKRNEGFYVVSFNSVIIAVVISLDSLPRGAYSICMLTRSMPMRMPMHGVLLVVLDSRGPTTIFFPLLSVELDSILASSVCQSNTSSPDESVKLNRFLIYYYCTLHALRKKSTSKFQFNKIITRRFKSSDFDKHNTYSC